MPAEVAELAIRIIHASGMIDVAEDLAFSGDCVAAGRAALAAGAPILCDCDMVAAGVIRRALPAASDVVVTVHAPEAAIRARTGATTRSAAAVELWQDRLGGSIVAIGNAPTALFRLLEGLDAGWPRPAVILGFPVGFVGATESKAELARDPRGVPFATLRGRRGGSAMASAAVNALALGLRRASS
jgi:precorrin-8X/cobalt-precorrin-8 methylmutase